ncbi:16S rRNA (cytosine967-C5)-methyltransferase [Nitrosomonas marina]|uniref:16S rRNA (cytosine(967)-C(5))-methyltransferase n=1 Tax=Nitrosomonas marina TaxID=917 RepID=A0A1I0ECN3_9PROT|nr:16S rRNA (cytosine(967)-C(5))-methyltransferase RsmB [Nitrosomonas marina]SET42788.1 16S rRNA (cytosine967-C5)-methyltransferase [Nitrosomonas marina]
MTKTLLISISVVNHVLAGHSLTQTLNECWQKHAILSGQQRGAIQDCSYGVLRFYGQLTEILAILLSKKPQDKKIYCLLLTGLYQLLYSKTPAYTIINQTVSAAHKLTQNNRLHGLVNAVLRNFLRQKTSLLAQVETKDIGRFSHPQWWINKLRSQYPQHYRSILNTGNKRPPMTVRVNQRKISVAGYQHLLSEHDMESQRIWHSALLLKKPVNVAALPGFSEGMVSVQDAGAQLAAPLLDAHQGMRVLDACAAPGGKSTHLMELADISLTVMDHDNDRLAQIEQNFERLGMRASNIICGNAADPGSWWDGKEFDRILADVPCSASGVVCRHPDIKWLRRESDLEKFVVQQQAILHALWQTLARNGKLLYVTCSVFMEENKWLIKQFLQHQNDARIETVSGPDLLDGQLLPDSLHDGFFYTLLHKL